MVAEAAVVAAVAAVGGAVGGGVVLVHSRDAVGHTPRGRCDEVEPYRPTWYDGQNREEQTRPLPTLG